MIFSLGVLYCLLDTEARARAARILSSNRAPPVISPIENKETRERYFNNFPPLSPDVPDTPQPPEPAVTTDTAGRGRGSQTPRPDSTPHHARSDSGGSQLLGVPQ